MGVAVAVLVRQGDHSVQQPNPEPSSEAPAQPSRHPRTRAYGRSLTSSWRRSGALHGRVRLRGHDRLLQSNPEWTFNDDFHDFFEIRGQLWRDDNGDPVRALEHVHHVSNDVNSVTGLTLHEHNHYTRLLDFVNGTVTLNGAINIMERRGAGQVIHVTGHKILDLETGEPLVIRGPDVADDEAFCAAVAP